VNALESKPIGFKFFLAIAEIVLVVRLLFLELLELEINRGASLSPAL